MSNDNLVPAIVQDYMSGEVLMLAYMNEESLKRTLATGTTWFWSRSRNQLWNKGETSGHKQVVKQVRYDCDGDTYLVLVDQIGVACHTGNRSCFYRSMYPKESERSSAMGWSSGRFLDELEVVIRQRQQERPAGSYTARLLDGGEPVMTAKILEESREVVDAVKGNDNGQVVDEAADLLYHLLVLLASRGLSLAAVTEELERRHKE